MEDLELTEGSIVALIGGATLLAMGIGLASVVVKVLRGTRLLADGTVSLDGTSPADPVALAGAAALTLDEYSLARMIESEAGGLSEDGRTGVAWACRNHATAAGATVTDLLLHATKAGTGFYGRQDQGRYASTSKDPSLSAIDVARRVIDGAVADPTEGADQWDSPWSYKDNPTTGETAAARAARIASARIAAGKVMVTLETVPERKLRFWRDA